LEDFSCFQQSEHRRVSYMSKSIRCGLRNFSSLGRIQPARGIPMSCYHGMRRGYPSLCRTGLGTNARGLRSWPGSQGMRGLTDLRSNAVGAFRRFRPGICERDPNPANSIFFMKTGKRNPATAARRNLERKRYWLVSRYLHRGLV